MSHPHANVIVKVGTTVAHVHPENAESIRLQLERASKIRSPAQHRAARARTGVSREYPRFGEGASAQKYVTDYYALNAEQFKGHTVDRLRQADAAQLVADFFQPLSTLPMFTPSGEVVEETI